MTETVVHPGPKIPADYLFEQFQKGSYIISEAIGRKGRVVFQPNRNRTRQLLIELPDKRRVSFTFDAGIPVRMISRDGKLIIEDV